MNNGKVRIYELSKELNLDNKDIKEICEQLNIAVKSHSSTITADDAERVKAVAAKSPRAEKSTDNQKKGKKTLKAPAKRKQQILAVHHRSDSADEQTDRASSNGASPRLVAPPSRPKAPANNGISARAPMPPKSPQVPSSPNDSGQAATPSEPEVAPSPKPAAVKPPRLSAPPARPQAKKTEKRSSIQPPIKPKIRLAEPTTSEQNRACRTRREKEKSCCSAAQAKPKTSEGCC